MKSPLGDEDMPWLLFLLAAAVLAMTLLSGALHEEPPRPAATTSQNK